MSESKSEFWEDMKKIKDLTVSLQENHRIPVNIWGDVEYHSKLPKIPRLIMQARTHNVDETGEILENEDLPAEFRPLPSNHNLSFGWDYGSDVTLVEPVWYNTDLVPKSQKGKWVKWNNVAIDNIGFTTRIERKLSNVPKLHVCEFFPSNVAQKVNSKRPKNRRWQKRYLKRFGLKECTTITKVKDTYYIPQSLFDDIVKNYQAVFQQVTESMLMSGYINWNEMKGKIAKKKSVLPNNTNGLSYLDKESNE